MPTGRKRRVSLNAQANLRVFVELGRSNHAADEMAERPRPSKPYFFDSPSAKECFTIQSSPLQVLVEEISFRSLIFSINETNTRKELKYNPSRHATDYSSSTVRLAARRRVLKGLSEQKEQREQKESHRVRFRRTAAAALPLGL